MDWRPVGGCQRVLEGDGCAAEGERDRAGASLPARGCASSRDGRVVASACALDETSQTERMRALHEAAQLWGRDAVSEVDEASAALGLDSAVGPGAEDGVFPALLGEPLGN